MPSAGLVVSIRVCFLLLFLLNLNQEVVCHRKHLCDIIKTARTADVEPFMQQLPARQQQQLEKKEKEEQQELTE